MKRVGIYVRVSKDDQFQDVENQLLQLRIYCQRNAYQIIQEFRDNESGRKGRRERSGFDAMFKDARKRKFDLLIFWSLDRFSREGMFKTIQYLRQLDEYGIKFHSFTEEYLNTNNELIAHLLISIMSYFAQLEAVKISERTKAGLQRAKAKGKVLGRPGLSEKLQEQIKSMKYNFNYSNSRISRETGCSVNTIKKYI